MPYTEKFESPVTMQNTIAELRKDTKMSTGKTMVRINSSYPHNSYQAGVMGEAELLADWLEENYEMTLVPLDSHKRPSDEAWISHQLKFWPETRVASGWFLVVSLEEVTLNQNYAMAIVMWRGDF